MTLPRLLSALAQVDLAALSHRELRQLQQAVLGLDDRIIRAKARRPSPSADGQRLEGA